MTLKSFKNKLDGWDAERKLYKEQGMKFQKLYKEEQEKEKNIESALKFIQNIAKVTQQTIENRLSTIVTSALQTVYPEENYEFKIKFVEKRGSTECQLLLIQDNEEYMPLKETGGGPIDIAALALLVAFIKLEKKRPVIITDEPFRFVSRQKIITATKLFKSICEKLDFQIITVTHFDEIIKHADKSFYVEKGEISG